MKPATREFFNKGTRADGLHSLCKPCHRAYSKNFYGKNRTRQRKLQRENYHSRCATDPIMTTASRLMHGIQKRTREKGWVESELTKERLVDLLITQTACECCRSPFYIGPKGGERHRRSPSIDRLDNDVGYTLENSKLICRRCNELKRDAAPEELRMIAEWIERKKLLCP